MNKLTNMSRMELDDIVNKKKVIIIELPKELDLKIHENEIEIAPSNVVSEPQTILDMSRLELEDDENKFNYLITRIYNQSGKVIYSNLDNGNYKAEIKW